MPLGLEVGQAFLPVTEPSARMLLTLFSRLRRDDRQECLSYQ